MSGTTGFTSCWAFTSSTLLLGAEGLFHRKDLGRVRHRGPFDPLHRVSDGGHGGLLFRVDLHRPPRPDLARRPGLRLRLLLRAHHPDHRHLLRQAQLAAGQALRLHHPGRHVRLLLQLGGRALADGADRVSLFDVLLRGPADGLGALFHWVAGVPVVFGAIFMAFIVWFYVCTGG
jgi:hypothetical protein